MLDSSPVALPARKPLKRTASTASLPPTPPRTHRKHARGRSRGSCDSDSDDHAVLSTDEEEDEPENSRKKRKLKEDEAANEDAFWLGGATTSAGLKPVQEEPQVVEGPSTKKKELPLIYRRMLAQQLQREQSIESVAPVSPPPSHRRVVKALPPPSTPPQTRATTKRTAFARDSPENPFLDTPVRDDEDVESPPDSSANPSPGTPDRSERPIVYMVFRGKRQAMPNRLYDHKNKRPFEPSENTNRDINDPQFEPSDFLTPKVLFPEARRKRRNAPRAVKKSRAISPEPSDDEREAGLDAIQPKKLDFGKPKQLQVSQSGSTSKAKTGVEKNRKTLQEEFKNVGEGFSA